jgi:hypothetical protein
MEMRTNIETAYKGKTHRCLASPNTTLLLNSTVACVFTLIILVVLGFLPVYPARLHISRVLRRVLLRWSAKRRQTSTEGADLVAREDEGRGQTSAKGVDLVGRGERQLLDEMEQS